MYKKITLIALVLFVIAHSEKIFSTRNVKNATLINSRLSTILPYLSPYNDQHFTRNNTKRSLFLLMPLSQTRNEREKPKETVQKTKRCNTLRRKNKARTKNSGRDINVGISKQNSNKMEVEIYKDKTFLQTLKDDLDADDVNLASEEKIKKCDTEKYICYCKEENCLPKSSKKSSSQILGSSRKDKSEKINHQRTENTRQNISQQRLTRLYYEKPNESHVSGQINSFPIRSYQKRVSIPCVSNPYGITPSVSQIVGNERKYVNVRIPCTLFDGRPNFLVGSNAFNHNRPVIRTNSHPCAPITRKDRIGDLPMSITSPSNYIDTTTIAETEDDFESYDPTVINRKHFSKLTTEVSNNFVDALANSKMKTNFYPTYSTDITEKSTADFSSLNELMHKLEGPTKPTKKDQDDGSSKLTPFLTDYVATSSASPIIYPSLTYDGKFINIKECIKLFGRNVCVFSATSPNMLIEQAQENNLNEYSTIKIPEYIIQTSTKKGTKLNNINYLNKFKTTEPYFASRSSTSRIETSNSDLHENLESISVTSKANVDETSELYQYTGSIKQTYKPDDDHNKSSSIIEDTRIPMKKLMDQTTDETIEIVRNKLLGKSKSHTIELSLSPNDENTANPISDEGFLYSTISYGFSVDKEVNNLEIGQKSPITNTNTNSWPSTLHKEETTTMSYDSIIRYNFEDENTNYLQGSNTNIYPEKDILREQPATIQYSNHKLNKESTTNSLETITNSSTRRLPFCDNTLLLNSIRKVINDFALDTYLTKTKDLNEDILQTQGKSLLPKILQVEDLKNILLIPQIENTIIEKVKDVLSDVTAIPRKDITSDWSHGVIRNSLRNILESLPQKLPPMTVEEHKFKDGQWMTNLASITSVPDSKLSIANPKNLQTSIRDLLNFSAIASQIDQYIVQNMIVQSVRNSLSNVEENEEMDNSIIHNALDDILQILKYSKNTDTLKKSNEFISDGKDMDMALSQEISTDDYEVGINVGNSILDDKQNFDVKENTKMNSKEMQTMVYQKAKTLEKNASIMITSESPDLSELYKEDKNTYIEEKIPNETIDKIRENVRNKIVDGMKKIDVQDDEEKKLSEPLKIITTYHKAILQNNPSILAPPVEPNLTKTKKLNEEGNTRNIFSEATTISSIMTKDFYERKKNIADLISRIKDINVQNEEETKNSDSWEHTTISQEPTSNLIFAKKSDEHNMNSHSIEEYSSKYDKIDQITVHANDDNHKLPINYYSANDPIIKHIKNHYIENESVTVETTPTNFMQETSPDYVKVSDGTISENMTEAKDVRDEMDYALNGKTLTSADNLISSANMKHRSQESEITVTSSTDEIDPAIILERIEYNLAPIKYYSPEILKYIKNHRISDKNIEVITAPTNFMQETSHNYKHMSDNITSQNMTGDKDIGDQIEYTLNRKALTSADNLISSTNVKYRNYEPKSTTTIDKDILRSQNFATEDNIVKIHEVTAEIQRTYAKTTYFKAKPSANVNPRIGSLLSACEATDCINNSDRKNKNSKNISNDSNNIISNKMNNIDSVTTEGNEITVSCFKSSSLNDTYSLQLFPSSTVSDNISELQKSQLYYISNDVRLPLEITRLKDGSYALSISKNICENIFKRKCPCCVPQQGHVVRLSRTDHYQKNMHTITTEKEDYEPMTKDHDQENVHANDVNRDYQLINQPLDTMITAISTRSTSRLQEPKKEEEKTSGHHLGKRNLNDGDLASSISMSVIDFAKKYNLLLNFDEKEMQFNKTDTHDKIQNKYKYDQSEEKNLNNNLEKKKNELLDENKNAINKSQNFINVREKKNSLETNFTRSPISQEFPNLKNSIKIELRKTTAEMNQPDISKEKTKIKNEEMNWDELANNEKGNIKVLHKKKERQHKEMELINNEQNISSMKVFKENSGKSYRYERTADSIANKRTELMKSMLYWLKDLFFQ